MRRKPNVSRRALAPGNGIFGCGDRATEIAARDERRPQRPKGPEIGRGNPGKNSLSELDEKYPLSRDWVVGTTGAKAKNKINDLCTLTGYSGALIANGNFQRRPPHPRVSHSFGLSSEAP
jgi:hypothetical protein